MRRQDPRPAIPRQGRRYGSLASFYTADERRIHSRELDVGLWWREGPTDPLHRAAWINDTGELYLVRLGPEAVGGGRVEVLATVTERERMEDLLQGWRERCGEVRSLSWLRTRVARGSAAARARMTRQPVSTREDISRSGVIFSHERCLSRVPTTRPAQVRLAEEVPR